MMSEEIHHRCRCLDRNFTFEEWIAYLKETEYGTGPVFAAGTFCFNINDVCCNPRRPVSIERARGYHVFLETAQSPCGRWDCGYDIAVHYTNSLRGAHFVDDPGEGFDTEDEAIYDALQYARHLAKREIGIVEKTGGILDEDDDFSPAPKSAVLRLLRGLLADIERQADIYDPRQLKLF